LSRQNCAEIFLSALKKVLDANAWMGMKAQMDRIAQHSNLFVVLVGCIPIEPNVVVQQIAPRV
jgi:hypothetical protein